jgi:hypothetical protein
MRQAEFDHQPNVRYLCIASLEHNTGPDALDSDLGQEQRSESR